MNTRSKIVTLAELGPIVERLKADGKKIVTTNGAFDLLHVGHVRALEESRSYGDVLIVGVNSDVSVKAYKSPSRPIIPEGDRAEMLAALSCVDYVVVFHETDPLRFLDLVKPDIHTKGGDYKPEELKEYGLITGSGGKIVKTESVRSTTSIIEKILKTEG